VSTGFATVFVLLCVLILIALRNSSRAPLTAKAQEVLIEAEEQATAIVHEATEEARALRADLERERLRALGEDRGEVERFIEAYRARLDHTLKDLSYGVEKEHMRATGHYVESLQKLERRVAGEAEEAKHSMDSFTTQSGALFDRLASEIENVEKGIQHLAIALEEAAANESDKNAEIVREEMRKIGQQTASSVLEVARGLNEVLRKNLEKEFAAVAKEVEKYRTARLELVDERVLVLIEETAQIALGKSVSMAEQSDLVYRALEEAKERGTFM
jgi:uncharacterized phage infection (PIP) family protein YhgE